MKVFSATSKFNEEFRSGEMMADDILGDVTVNPEEIGAHIVFQDLSDEVAEVTPPPTETAIATMSSKYKVEYNRVLDEYNNLINDSSYQGVNLLKGNSLEFTFNETRSNKFKVVGKDISAATIGINQANWNNMNDAIASINELKSAIEALRGFASELGNSYSIIQTRQNFTDALSDVLETGADNLTLADMNEEAANYLALQTRQQLAVNSLSLAAQSAQSVLKLF